MLHHKVPGLELLLVEEGRLNPTPAERPAVQGCNSLLSAGGVTKLDEDEARAGLSVPGHGNGQHFPELCALLLGVLDDVVVFLIVLKLLGGHHVLETDDLGWRCAAAPLRGLQLPIDELGKKLVPVQVGDWWAIVLDRASNTKALPEVRDAVQVQHVVRFINRSKFHEGELAAQARRQDWVPGLRAEANFFHGRTKELLEVYFIHVLNGIADEKLPVHLGVRVNHGPIGALPRQLLPGGPNHVWTLVLGRAPNFEHVAHERNAIDVQAVCRLLNGSALDESELVAHPALNDGVPRSRVELHLLKSSIEELHQHHFLRSGGSVAHEELARSFVGRIHHPPHHAGHATPRHRPSRHAGHPARHARGHPTGHPTRHPTGHPAGHPTGHDTRHSRQQSLR
mmetsp:Transcript_23855/g.69883  ORF Transcript_23855/g.69883 Transcript_23855/m.69883 type:complete len:396 (+) Transcript_23855:320-1507(+)